MDSENCSELLHAGTDMHYSYPGEKKRKFEKIPYMSSIKAANV